jgi:hypothetical protein
LVVDTVNAMHAVENPHADIVRLGAPWRMSKRP